MSARLGLGMAAVGRPAYITTGRGDDLGDDRSPDALRARSAALLDAAAALGVDHLDAARSYGRAEEFLAGWLADRHPAGSAADGAAPFVASKWGYAYTGGWRLDAEQHEAKDHSAAALARQWPQTRALLGPWLRLLQVHSLTTASPLWEDEVALRALAGLRDGGLEVGFSTSGPDQAEAVRRGTDLAVDGVQLFTSVQTTWNPLEPSAAAALAAARAAGLRVVVKEALANGRLLDGGAATAGLRAAAAELGAPLDTTALAVALAQPWADVVLSGAVTTDQLRRGADARALAGALVSADPGELAAAEAPREYWDQRSHTPWS